MEIIYFIRSPKESIHFLVKSYISFRNYLFRKQILLFLMKTVDFLRNHEQNYGFLKEVMDFLRKPVIDFLKTLLMSKGNYAFLKGNQSLVSAEIISKLRIPLGTP